MGGQLPIDLGSDRRLADAAFVRIVRLSLRGVAPGDDAAIAIADDVDVLRQTLHRFERLLDDGPSATWERARAIVVSALAQRAVGRTA